jgi:hypothetical protein
LKDISSADFFIGVSYVEPFEVNNAIVGCIPQHPLMTYLTSKLKENFEKEYMAKQK